MVLKIYALLAFLFLSNLASAATGGRSSWELSGGAWLGFQEDVSPLHALGLGFRLGKVEFLGELVRSSSGSSTALLGLAFHQKFNTSGVFQPHFLLGVGYFRGAGVLTGVGADFVPISVGGGRLGIRFDSHVVTAVQYYAMNHFLSLGATYVH